MEIAIVHNPKQNMKMDYSTYAVAFLVMYGWYTHYFGFDFIQQFLQFSYGLGVILNVMRQPESTIEKLLDVFSKMITLFGGIIILIITPTVNMYANRLKDYIKKKTTRKTKHGKKVQ